MANIQCLGSDLSRFHPHLSDLAPLNLLIPYTTLGGGDENEGGESEDEKDMGGEKGEEEEEEEEEEDAIIPQDLACAVCHCRTLKLQFRQCPHAACASCTEGIWNSRRFHTNHYPAWFTCHLCRAEISEVGVLAKEGGEVRKHGEGAEGAFTVAKWETVSEWMAGRMKWVEEGLNVVVENEDASMFRLWRDTLAMYNVNLV